LNPLQQYRVVQLAPRTRNVALSLNASAIYLGQGTGAGLGALALGYGSLATLGWTGSICILAALAVLLLTNSSAVHKALKPYARRAFQQVSTSASQPSRAQALADTLTREGRNPEAC
jgi:hypothetical protein